MFPRRTAHLAREALQAAGARLVYREIEDLSHTYPRDENPQDPRLADERGRRAYGLRITRVAAVPGVLALPLRELERLVDVREREAVRDHAGQRVLVPRAHEQVERGRDDPRVVVRQRRAT